MEQASGEVPCSGARQRDKAERSERRDSSRRSRLERSNQPRKKAERSGALMRRLDLNVSHSTVDIPN